MPDIPPSRRQFLATGTAAAAATTVDAQGRQPVVATETGQPQARRSSEPIRVLTAAAFEPHELERFKSAAPNVEMIVVKTPEEFRRRLPEAALKEEWIAGAGLDVFPVEPPPSTHPIFDCKNVVMTPHTSGWSRDRQTRLIDLHAENLRRYAIGAPLLNVVDKTPGY